MSNYQITYSYKGYEGRTKIVESPNIEIAMIDFIKNNEYEEITSIEKAIKENTRHEDVMQCYKCESIDLLDCDGGYYSCNDCGHLQIEE